MIKYHRNELPTNFSSWLGFCQYVKQEQPHLYERRIIRYQPDDCHLRSTGLPADIEPVFHAYEIDIQYAKLKAFEELEECGDLPTSDELLRVALGARMYLMDMPEDATIKFLRTLAYKLDGRDI